MVSLHIQPRIKILFEIFFKHTLILFSVSRMVKYTGYGNAAGMFANKGLLGPDKGKAAYSSESEDSETEEYLKHKEQWV